MARGTRANTLTIFLAGDVMLGRGIDQIMPRSCRPHLYEPWVRDARDYVRLAEEANGTIPRGVRPNYVWGDALAEMDRHAPDARVINLETAVTVSEEAWSSKGIHYRMHPENLRALQAAKTDVSVLANNHVLDWGREGLGETLNALTKNSLDYAGAGVNIEEASMPGVIDCGEKGRVLVFGCGLESSGIPPSWAATKSLDGVFFLPDLSSATAERLIRTIDVVREPRDLVVLSVHWGPNWGYGVVEDERRFAREMIDTGRVDVVHGHSSHHPRPVEVYRGCPIFYGCGDLINDYEGISGHEEYLPDLAFLYFAHFEPEQKRLVSLTLSPVERKRFRLHRASKQARLELLELMNFLGQQMGFFFEEDADGDLTWKK